MPPLQPRARKAEHTKKAGLAGWIHEHRPTEIGESELDHIREALAPISESYLHKLLRESGAHLHPLVDGVHQGNLDELEASLRLLADFYEFGDAARRMKTRKLVITAKDHARLASRAKSATPEKQAEKQEMILWLTTWLENPPLFSDWVRIRRRQLEPANRDIQEL
jgi:hypothetical protein